MIMKSSVFQNIGCKMCMKCLSANYVLSNISALRSVTLTFLNLQPRKMGRLTHRGSLGCLSLPLRKTKVAQNSVSYKTLKRFNFLMSNDLLPLNLNENSDKQKKDFFVKLTKYIPEWQSIACWHANRMIICGIQRCNSNNSAFAFTWLPSFPSGYCKLGCTARTVTLVQFISSLMFSKLYTNSNSIQLSIFIQSWSIVYDLYGDCSWVLVINYFFQRN